MGKDVSIKQLEDALLKELEDKVLDIKPEVLYCIVLQAIGKHDVLG